MDFGCLVAASPACFPMVLCLLCPLCSYMDAINRRLALAFLLEFAWRNPDRKILLLTPQDISGGCFEGGGLG